MLLVFLAIVLWLPAVLGWGLLVGARMDDPGLRLTVSGFLGLAALSAVASTISLAAPIGPEVAVGALAAGYLAFARRWARSRIDSIGLRWMLGATVVAAALTVHLGRHYDTGLYYLQAVRWLTERGPVRGLANLHGRLGFDSAWIPLAAVLEIPGLKGRSALVAGALPVVLTVPAVVSGIRRVIAGDSSWMALLQVGLAMPLLLALQGIGSLHTDHPASLIGCLALLLLLAGLQDRSTSLVGEALLMATFTFTIKLSMVILLVGMLLAFFWAAYSLSPAERLRYAGGSVALLALWAVRGLLLSGCVGWPATLACLSTPWTSTSAAGQQLAAAVQSWARYPGGPPEVARAGWGWLGAWCRIQASSALAWVVLSTAAAGTLAAWCRRRDAPRVAWWAATISCAGVAFWFVTAPDPRFGLVYLLGGPLVFLAYDFSASVASVSFTPRRLAFVGLIGAATVALAGMGSLAISRPRWGDFHLLQWPAFPVARTRVVTTDSGLSVLVPAGSDQCWAAPLPCAPSVSPGLSFRAGGFVMDTSSTDSELMFSR